MKHIKNKFLIYSLFTLGFSAQIYANENGSSPKGLAVIKRIPVPPPIAQEYF